MKSFKDSLNEKDKYFGINPSKAARIAKWNNMKESIRKEWQKVSIPRTLTTAVVVGLVGFGGIIAHQSLTARSIDKETELNSWTTRSLVNEAMQRRADRIIERYDLKGKVARGVRNYVESEVEKMGLKSNLSSIEARVKKIILRNMETEKVENAKKRSDPAATVTVKQELSLSAKHEVMVLETEIKEHRHALSSLRAGGDSSGYKPETVAGMDKQKRQIAGCMERIYQLDPSRRPAAPLINPSAPQAKITETATMMVGKVVGYCTYEFPISKSYEVSRIRKDARPGNTGVGDFERVQISDMCDFPFSIVKVEKGLSEHFVLVPHTAFRNGDKVSLSVKEISGGKISYQQIIDQALGQGYKAMQTADVWAEYIAVESKRTD